MPLSTFFTDNMSICILCQRRRKVNHIYFSANLQGKYGYVCVILTNYVALKCNKTYEIYCIILLTIKNNAITTKLIAIDICKKAIMNFVYSRKKFFDRKTGRVHKKTRRLLTLYEFWMPFGKLEIYWTQC